METHVQRLFSYGFRPLFLCMVAAGLLLVPWWLLILRGLLPAPNVFPSIITWHGHEMLLGFVGAAIGGFLLTAVANWTRRPPVSGWSLALLVVSWIAARFVVAYDLGLSSVYIALVDVSYWLLLSLFMGREILLAKNYRNLKIVGVLMVFAALTLVFHLEYLGLSDVPTADAALRAILMLVCVMISIIGGRIIPAFTGNWLRGRAITSLPSPEGMLDRAAVTATVFLVALYGWLPGTYWTGGLLILAGLLHLARLARWRGHFCWRDPLVLVLHVGYFWLGLGIFLMGISTLWPHFTISLGVHGVTVGAMAGLIFAVASRAALGHTNRPLKADTLMAVAFAMINVAAIVRVLTAFASEVALLTLSGVAWMIAILAFAIRFAPVLLAPAVKSPVETRS